MIDDNPTPDEVHATEVPPIAASLADIARALREIERCMGMLVEEQIKANWKIGGLK